jgi:hypothetical protein
VWARLDVVPLGWDKVSTITTCIYCKLSSGTAKGVAHVLPEGIVANRLVLPRGAECDSCNSALGTIDRELVKHNRIRGPIMVLGIPGKGGHRRRALGGIERNHVTGDLAIRPVIKKVTKGDKGWEFEVADDDPVDLPRFRRALHHMALNFLAHQYGVEYCLDSAFDGVRNYVRKARTREDWPYVQVMLGDGIRGKLGLYELVGPGRLFCFRSFADDFVVDVSGSGQLHGWAKDTFGSQVGLF